MLQVFYHIRACDPLQRRFYYAMMTRTQVYNVLLKCKIKSNKYLFRKRFKRNTYDCICSRIPARHWANRSVGMLETYPD